MNKNFKSLDYSAAKVLIASPSVGNVGQLSLDLFISTLKAEHVGMIWHKGILPFVGGDPYNESSPKICSSNDVYYCKENNLFLVQLRAPLHRSHFIDYCTEIVKLLKDLKASQIVILSGMFAHQRDDSELRAGTFRYICNQKQNENFNFQDMAWTRMKGNDSENNYACPRLPGAGFTRTLYDICGQFEMPCTALLYFCSEGDNVQDGINLTKKADECLKILQDKNMVQPPSWKYLFGNGVPPGMY